MDPTNLERRAEAVEVQHRALRSGERKYAVFAETTFSRLCGKEAPPSGGVARVIIEDGWMEVLHCGSAPVALADPQHGICCRAVRTGIHVNASRL